MVLAKPKAVAISKWAAALNARNMKTDLPLFQAGGKVRLINYAAYYGRLLELCQAGHWWDHYVEYLGKLSIGIRDGVFLGRGPETARDAILAELHDAGFRRSASVPGAQISQSLLDAIHDGDVTEVVDVIRNSFVNP